MYNLTRWLGCVGRHLHQIGVAVDQLVNTLFGGWADESICSRIHRNAVKGYWYAVAAQWLLDLVFSPIKRNHCLESYLSEIKRSQLPPAFRRGSI